MMAQFNESKIDPQKYYQHFLSHDLRPDGRSLNAFRPMSMNVKSLCNADGSAIVRIGNTSVVCGIKAELAKPKAEAGDLGYLVANVELPPMCSNTFQPGPPSDKAQVAARFLDQILHNSNCVNLKDLCIVPDTLVWVLYLDVICLNYDGGTLDASCIAAVAALKTLTLPHIEYNSENGNKSVDISNRKHLKISSSPIPTSFAVFENDKILNDPTAEEETLSTGLMTVTVCGETGETCGIHHPGSAPLQSKQLEMCMSAAVKKTKKVMDLFHAAMSSPER